MFARGSDRESARRSLVVALKELVIRGDIRTTVEYIIRMLQSETFVGNNCNSNWLDHRIENSRETMEQEAVFLPSCSLIAMCGLLGDADRHGAELRHEADEVSTEFVCDQPEQNGGVRVAVAAAVANGEAACQHLHSRRHHPVDVGTHLLAGESLHTTRQDAAVNPLEITPQLATARVAILWRRETETPSYAFIVHRLQ